ncbi:hypothetical protein Tco_0256286 [Tanacetum coccineum]
MQTHESKIDTSKAMDADLVITESSGTESEVQDDISRSGNDTDVDDADIRPIYDEEPMNEVQLTAECNIFAIGQQHIKQPEIIHEGRVDQYPEQCQVQSPILDSSLDNQANEARKKTQEIDKNSKTSVMPFARLQNTTKGSKPKSRSNNQTSRSLPVSKSSFVTITAVPKAYHSKNSSSFSDSKHFVCSTCQKCVFNANHDACITKLLKEVNSRAKIQSYKTRNSNNPVDQKSHTQKPGRQIFTRHRFSPNKTSAVYEKTSPKSDLRWKPTGRTFKSGSLRWIPTGKLFDSCTSKVGSKPPHGSNVDIPNIHECKQILDVSAGTSANVQKEQSLDLSASTLFQASLLNVKEVPTADMISMTSMIELESLFGPLFDEYFNGENLVVSKSSAITTADASDKR